MSNTHEPRPSHEAPPAEGDILATLTAVVAALDEKEALRLTAAAVAEGHPSVDVLRAVEAGVRGVGERYEAEEIFLAGLIMAGEIFRGAMDIAPPGLDEELTEQEHGRVLIGTVAGDIHDIGKNVAALTLRSFGFTVKDLGVNVPAERFLSEAKEFAPHVIGLSGLISLAFTAMRDTVTLLHTHLDAFAVRPAILIGGGTIDEQVARYIGADYWTTDAMEGVRICQRYMERNEE